MLKRGREEGEEKRKKKKEERKSLILYLFSFLLKYDILNACIWNNNEGVKLLSIFVYIIMRELKSVKRLNK